MIQSLKIVKYLRNHTIINCTLSYGTRNGIPFDNIHIYKIVKLCR